MRDPGMTNDERHFHMLSIEDLTDEQQLHWCWFFSAAGWSGHIIPDELFYTMHKAHRTGGSPEQFPSPEEWENRPTVKREVDIDYPQPLIDICFTAK